MCMCAVCGKKMSFVRMSSMELFADRLDEGSLLNIRPHVIGPPQHIYDARVQHSWSRFLYMATDHRHQIRMAEYVIPASHGRSRGIKR